MSDLLLYNKIKMNINKTEAIKIMQIKAITNLAITTKDKRKLIEKLKFNYII